MTSTSPKLRAYFTKNAIDYVHWGHVKSAGDAQVFLGTVLKEHEALIKKSLSRMKAFHVWKETGTVRFELYRLLRYIKHLKRTVIPDDVEDPWTILVKKAADLTEFELTILSPFMMYDPDIESIQADPLVEEEEEETKEEPIHEDDSELTILTKTLPVKESEDNTDSEEKKKKREEIMEKMVTVKETIFSAPFPTFSQKDYSHETEYKGYSVPE